MSVTMLPGGGFVSGFRPNGSTEPSTPVQSGATASSYITDRSQLPGWIGNMIPDSFFEHGKSMEDYYKQSREDGSLFFESMLSKAEQGDEAAIQWLANYFASEESSRTAREWTAQREDTAYQRLIADLQKAGISPYVLTGASPAISSSSGHSYSGTEMTSRANNRDTNAANNQQKVVQAVMSFIGVLMAALIYAAV